MNHDRLRLPVGYRIRAKLRRVIGRLDPIDDFDWERYNQEYRAEIAWNRQRFSEDLATTDVLWHAGRLYVRGHERSLMSAHVCVWEAVGNLRPRSVAEIGVGGGRYLAGLLALHGDSIELSGYDLNPEQLQYFRELYPEAAKVIHTDVLDITERPVPDGRRPELALAATVLMHIKRPQAYRSALTNTLSSASKFVVLLDNYAAHDYFGDLTSLAETNADLRLYVYDSGRNQAIVIALQGQNLSPPFEPLMNRERLQKYQ